MTQHNNYAIEYCSMRKKNKRKVTRTTKAKNSKRKKTISYKKAQKSSLKLKKLSPKIKRKVPKTKSRTKAVKQASIKRTYKRKIKQTGGKLRFAVHIIFIIVSLFFIKNSNIQNLIYKSDYLSPSDMNSITLSTTTNTQILADAPEEIFIPTLNIKTKITDKLIEVDDNEGFEPEAMFDKNLNTLGQNRSHTMIYAHARPMLFRNLPYISNVDKIYVRGVSNTLYEYDVTDVETISPKDIDKVESIGEKNLSLVTCQGTDDEYRLLVSAKLVGNYKINHKEVI